MFNTYLDELLARYDNMVCEQFCKYKEECAAINDGECALSVAAETLLVDLAKEMVKEYERT